MGLRRGDVGAATGPHPSALFEHSFYEWQSSNRPHNVLSMLAAGEWRQLDPWQKELDDLFARAEEAGLRHPATLPE